ncbi:hypothetical protein L7F22_029790 [Adiantum nelumboides]|nr:hypothetical protein [Adiantum nelumboides]
MAAAVASMVAKSSSSLCSQLSISWDASNFCRKRTFFATCSSHSNSPFTESYSVKPLRGAGKLEIISNLYTVLSHERKEGTSQHGEDFLELEQEQEQEHDIATRLLELRQLLSLLHNDERKQEKAHGIGNVFLVGTGPGDPDFLTVKALKLMQTADLVLYDRLVSTDILDLVHAGACLLHVGKTAGYHSRTQDEIHQLLLSFAEAGATVLRLKGGDPLVFGRGGEEMDFLQQQGVHVRVVPGITAASGIAAELGIPLTHRGAANRAFKKRRNRPSFYETLHLWCGGQVGYCDPRCIAKRASPDNRELEPP